MVLVSVKLSYVHIYLKLSTLGQKRKKIYRFHNGHFIAVGRVPTYFFFIQYSKSSELIAVCAMRDVSRRLLSTIVPPNKAT